MAKRNRGWLDRLCDYGIGFAYTLILLITLGSFLTSLLVVAIIVSWWERIR